MSAYNYLEIEAKWQQFWDDHKTFQTAEHPNPGKKLYVLDMFPYPSGSGLHMGHPLGYTGSDIYSRAKRMQGYSVLHPMGYDAFGLPAEQYAIATGEHPGKFTAQNCKRFTAQCKSLGFSYDWDREVASCDAEYYHWTQWIFLRLYNSWFDETQQKARPISELPVPAEITQQGEVAVQQYQSQHRLAYFADAMVNWCPELGTVLANEEVIDGKSERGGHDVIRKPMKQWILRITKYSERLIKDLELLDWPEAIKEQQRNWIGRREGAEISFRVQDSDLSLTAFTTRPDTLFGVTFFVISPEHPAVKQLTTTAQKKPVEDYCEAAAKLSDLARTMENRQKTGVFTGSYVLNPISGEAVPVYVGDYVLSSYGTGAVMGVPAHDDRDFEFAKVYQLPVVPVLAPLANELDSAKLEEVKSGKYCWTESGQMLPMKFPVFKELALEGASNVEAGRKIVIWLEKNASGKGVVTYRLRDWLFSRQRYWGEPIPIINWEDGTVSSLADEDLPLRLPDIQDYRPSDDGESPLAKANDWLNVVDPKTGKRGRRETNTMPQWAGSCWYYLRFIDPKNSKAGWDAKLEQEWMPVDLYVGGAEHAVLHLLYARFWHKVLFDLGYVSTPEPFKKLFNQGMLVSSAFKDKRGALIAVDLVEELPSGEFRHKDTGEIVEKISAKMSKSLKNVVTPDEIIERYGADTLRMFLMFLAPLEAMKTWDTKAISGVHRFLHRVWTLVTGGKEQGVAEFVSEEQEDSAITAGRHALIKKVTEDIDGIRFNTSIAAMMEFINLVSAPAAKVSRATIEALVKVLSPFAPHMTEELWQRLGYQQSISSQPWPEFDEQKLKKTSWSVVIQVQGKKRGEMEVPAGCDQASLQDACIAAMAGTNYPVKAEDKFIIVFDKDRTTPRLVNVIPK